ncbi:primase C-terminal domain-containing protein [Kurthia sp. Dielmo]|uniref:primase C-terminal domain-containing protein n=1 Tax=Kurthia sp. Dielmo TaxID=1033738 RepID=UPI001122AE74|nr:primase C-terminal domain-containing protein [Kurthia sp. Dielmo]
MPSRHNVVWSNLNQTYSFKQLIQWSSTFDDGESLYHSHKEVHNPYLSEWLDALLQIKNVKSQKGQIGRNNTLFSAALVCYQSGLTTDEAHNYIQTLNGRFDTPIDKNEMRSILDSAYSGRYKGAKLDYLKMLLDLYAPDVKHPISMNGWYKFKKNRIDRVRSHFEEWESDISDYITLHMSEHTPFIWKTQSELCKEIGIPQSTLNALLKKFTTLLKVVKGKGRTAMYGHY